MSDQTFFDEFELIPAEADDFTPDEELADLVAPDDVEDVESGEEAIPLGRTWQMNYDTGTMGARPLPIGGYQSVVMIAQLALRTKRGLHEIFDDDFGLDRPDVQLGQVDTAEYRALMQRDVVETLLTCHERITRVGDFLFTYNPDDEVMYVDLSIEIDGEEDIRLEGVPLA
jgi:hypothetical protein